MQMLLLCFKRCLAGNGHFRGYLTGWCWLSQYAAWEQTLSSGMCLVCPRTASCPSGTPHLPRAVLVVQAIWKDALPRECSVLC